MTPERKAGGHDVIRRQAELSRLDSFLDDVADGPTALVLEGESGIGKTTLWRRGVGAAADRGWRVLSTRPAQSEAKLSFAGLADLLEASDDLFDGLPDPQRNALEVALLKAEPESEGSSDARAVSAAVLSTLREAAGAGPVLLSIDDAQWLDASTTSALGFAVRRLATEPIGIFLATREAGSALPFGLSRALAEERVARIRLEPLSVDDLGALLHDRLQANLPRPTLRRLHEMSGGNPFFALEITRAELAGERRPTGAALPVPRTLRDDLLRDRLRTLPFATRETVLYASACSRPMIGLLNAAVRSSDIQRQLSRATDAGIVEIDGGEVRFTHPLYGSAIYAEASREHRHRVHRRLAEVVDDPEERARHLALAADGPDPVAADALEGAAVLAGARGAPAAAAELLELAERLTPPEDRAHVRRQRMAGADYRLLAGEYQVAIGLLEPVASTAPSGPERAEALLRLGRALVLSDDARGAADVLAEALRQEGVSPKILSPIHRWRSLVVASLGDLTAAESHAEEALRLAEGTADPTSLAGSLTAVCTIRAWLGRGIQRELMDRALALETKFEPDSVVDRPSFILAELGARTGEIDQSRALFDSFLHEATLRGDEVSASILHWESGWVEWLAGSWSESLDHFVMSTVLASGYADAIAARAQLEACSGDIGAAREHAQQALDAAARTGSVDAQLLALSALGFLELSLGNAPQAHEQLGRAWSIHRAYGVEEPLFFPFVADHAEALLELGRYVEAGVVVDWLEERGQALDRSWALAVAARYRGLLAAAAGDYPAAFASLDRALKEHERLPMPFELGRTLLVQGAIRRRAKQKRPARESLEEALAIFEQLGAPLWADKAKAELARIGGRRAVVGELTAAEHRVATLAAAGRTNREIADTLFMSVRTVEGHLSHIYAKLGIRSRTELALYIDAAERSRDL